MTIIRHKTVGDDGPAPRGLHERLEVLEAAEAARGALARYAQAIDAQDLAAFSALLARDVELEIGGDTIRGRVGVVDFLRDAFASDRSQKSHFVTNVKTRWVGDGLVNVEAYFLWTAGESARSVIGWGTYANQVRMAGGEGLFTRIAIGIRHMGDLGDGWPMGSDG